VPPQPDDKALDIGKALVVCGRLPAMTFATCCCTHAAFPKCRQSAPREYPYWIAHARVRPLDTMPDTKRKACELVCVPVIRGRGISGAGDLTVFVACPQGYG
jgi:hypothetical protein